MGEPAIQEAIWVKRLQLKVKQLRRLPQVSLND
jgi:hypothetical protein